MKAYPISRTSIISSERVTTSDLIRLCILQSSCCPNWVNSLGTDCDAYETRYVDLFDSSYEHYPTQAYPDSNEDIILGLCFGELSATAVCVARNLVELLPIAVEAVRQAFRGGILTSTTARELEPQEVLEESWSLAVPRDCGLGDNERIKQICEELVRMLEVANAHPRLIAF